MWWHVMSSKHMCGANCNIPIWIWKGRAPLPSYAGKVGVKGVEHRQKERKEPRNVKATFV